jgi:LysR family glycine cleavage system transcriptional activator
MRSAHGRDPLRGVPMEALRAFEAAARHLNFTHAARDLNLTQSAVSRAIHTLEERVGAPLFKRTKGRLTLTEAGQSLQQDLASALTATRNALERASTIAARAALVVRVPRSLAVGWLHRKLLDFSRLHPQIDVRLSLAPRAQSPEDRLMSDEAYGAGCDLTIRLLPRARAEGRLQRVVGEQVVPCCTPHVAKAAGLKSIDGLFRRTLIEFDDSQEPLDANWGVWARLHRCAIPASAQWLRAPDWHSVFELAVQGRGVCLGRTPLVNEHLRSGALVAPLAEVTLSTRAYYLVSAGGGPVRREAGLFMAWLCQEVEKEEAFERRYFRDRRVFDPIASRKRLPSGGR